MRISILDQLAPILHDETYPTIVESKEVSHNNDRNVSVNRISNPFRKALTRSHPLSHPRPRGLGDNTHNSGDDTSDTGGGTDLEGGGTVIGAARRCGCTSGSGWGSRSGGGLGSSHACSRFGCTRCGSRCANSSASVHW
jgi:hypothetical protein